MLNFSDPPQYYMVVVGKSPVYSANLLPYFIFSEPQPPLLFRLIIIPASFFLEQSWSFQARFIEILDLLGIGHYLWLGGIVKSVLAAIFSMLTHVICKLFWCPLPSIDTIFRAHYESFFFLVPTHYDIIDWIRKCIVSRHRNSVIVTIVCTWQCNKGI